MCKTKNDEFNIMTPQWFRDWHRTYYRPLTKQVSYNTKWIYIIVAAVFAAALTGNLTILDIEECLAHLLGG